MLSITGLILSTISNGPVYLGANLAVFPNLEIPLHGLTLRNTKSPSWNSNFTECNRKCFVFMEFDHLWKSDLKWIPIHVTSPQFQCINAGS